MVQRDARKCIKLHEITPQRPCRSIPYYYDIIYPKPLASYIISKVENKIRQRHDEYLVPDFFELKFSDEKDKIRIESSISQNDFEKQIIDEIKSLGLENISPEVFVHYRKTSKLNNNKNEMNGSKDKVQLEISSAVTVTSAMTIPYSSTQSIEGSDPQESTSTDLQESNIWDPESGEFSTDSIKARRGGRGTYFFKQEEGRDTLLSNNTSLESSEDKKNLCNTNSTEASENNHVGLVNQAMTCYLNSLLQALFMTPEFRNAMYKWEYKNNEKDSEVNSIPYQLQRLFLNLQTSHKTAVETTSLTKSFGWDVSDSWHQHDIQELCRVMFDALEQKFKNTAQADLINQLYEGKINDYVKCLSCNTEKSREDTFLDIPLPVRPYDNNVAYGSVEEALEAFVKYETLEGSNQYFCEKCDKKSDAHKGLKFTKFPYILTLQLKRFDFDHNTYNRIKLNDKVTFPETLNLNSFIEPSCKQESPSREEDIVENSTTDVNDTVENCVSNDSLLSNSNHLNNREEDDEGVTMENGSYSPCCSSHNESVDKLRKEYASAKGPYIYELFSIMIHSGSASGGHYYAYIKDFKTNKWYCFNDQIVSSITKEEIQKSYGGGTRTMYYSGVYRSSTNAYMLMYRQIDPERNTNPMEAKDFPPHIKKLLEKMKSEEEQSYRDERSSMERRFKHTVYYRSSPNDEVEKHEVLISMNLTLNQVVDTVLKKTPLHYTYDNSQCRIVTYLPSYNLVDTTFDDREEFRLDRLFSSQHNVKPFLLDVRSQNAKFDSYPSEPIITKVYVIDAIDKELVRCSKYIRAYQKQTVREYKQELVKHLSLDLNALQLYCPEILPNKLLDDDFVFDSLISSIQVYRITATDSNNEDLTNNFLESTLYKMHEQLNDVITFYIDRKNVTKEQLDNLNIPSVTNHYRDVKNHENISCYDYNSKDLAHLNVNSFNHYKSTISEIVPKTDGLYNLNWRSEDERNNDVTERQDCKMDDMCPKLKCALDEIEINQTTKEKSRQEESDKEVQTNQSIIGTLSKEEKKSISRNNNNNNNTLSVKEHKNAGAISRTLHEFDKDKNEDWDAQETTNSEDSSLSDSDRTLVGDAPEDFNYDRYHNFPIAMNTGSNDVSYDKLFKVEPLRRQDLLKVSMDIRVTEEDLKQKLEPFLDIPKEYFKIVDYYTNNLDDLHSITYSSSDRLLFRDDQKYTINLERILKADEVQITIYFLDPDAKEFLEKLFTIIVKKNATMFDIKGEITAKLKKLHTGKSRLSCIPQERWRFMEIVNDCVGTSIEEEDYYKILPESSREFCIQEIVPRVEQNFTQIHAIKWNPSKTIMTKSPREEIKIEENADFMEQLKKKLSEATLISEENLEFYLLEAAKDIDLNKVESTQWKSDIQQDQLDHKTHLLFRDSSEKSILLTDASTSNKFNGSQVRNARLKSRGLEPVPVSSSPRKEKALKIRVGST